MKFSVGDKVQCSWRQTARRLSTSYANTAGSTNTHTMVRATGANGGKCDGCCEVYRGTQKNVREF